MKLFINELCIKCGTCEQGCPGDAIQKKNGRYVIDPDSCLQCGTCFSNCPTGAIVNAKEDDQEDIYVQ